MIRLVNVIVLLILGLLFLGKGVCFASDTSLLIVSQTDTPLPSSQRQAIDWDRSADEIELTRYKRQTLQSVSISSGGVFELGNGDLNSSFLDVGVGTGIPLGSFDNILGMTPRFRVDWINASPGLDVPRELYAFELQLFFRRPLNDRLSWLAIASPSIRSDLTTSERAFRVFALALLNWEWIPERLTLSAGVVSLGRADLPVLPALGIVWQPNRLTQLDLRFPLTKLSYRLAKRGGESEIWTYVSGGIGGNTWAVTRVTDRSDELSLRDYRLSFGLERLVNGGGRCFAELGFAFGRRLEYESDGTEIDLDSAALIQAGWRY